MNEYDIKRLALILAIQTEVEAMKTENLYWSSMKKPLTYLQEDFIKKSEELRELAYKHNEQL